MELTRQEYWSWLPSPSPEDLPNPEIEPKSLGLQVDSLPLELSGKPNRGGLIISITHGLIHFKM